MKSIPRGIACLIIIIALFGYLSSVMGFTNMLNTIMRTAHDLLLNTVFYLMAMCVLTGALSRIFSVFGVVDLLQRILPHSAQRADGERDMPEVTIRCDDSGLRG